MFVRGLVACLLALLIQVSVASGADNASPRDGDHDFSGKLLGIVTRSYDKSGEVGGCYVEKVKVRKLGDRYFLVGSVPDLGGPYTEIKGTVVWTPIAEIISINEFDSIQAAKKAVQAVQQAGGPETPLTELPQ